MFVLAGNSGLASQAMIWYVFLLKGYEFSSLQGKAVKIFVLEGSSSGYASNKVVSK